MKYSSILFTLLLSTLWLSPAASESLPRMRVSVENTANHIQTKAVKKFCDDLSKKLDNRIHIVFYSNAELFRDKDIIPALSQGKVEMAVPGTWHVTRFEPNIGLFLLPMFYGRPPQSTHQTLDSPAGAQLNQMIEKNLGLKVLGQWIDLGHAHLFSTSIPIRKHEDIKGLTIRVAGGVGNKLRIAALGADPIAISWPDLPDYITQGRVDAVLTSYETIKSARLWENGIKYAFEDRQYFPQYIPLVRFSFWKKLSPDIQKIISDTWAENIDTYRTQAQRAQAHAKKTLIENGIQVVVPDNTAIQNCREAILDKQPEFIRTMKIDPKLAEQVMETL